MPDWLLAAIIILVIIVVVGFYIFLLALIVDALIYFIRGSKENRDSRKGR